MRPELERQRSLLAAAEEELRRARHRQITAGGMATMAEMQRLSSAVEIATESVAAIRKRIRKMEAR